MTVKEAASDAFAIVKILTPTEIKNGLSATQSVRITVGSLPDAFGDAGTEFGGSDNFSMAAVAEDKTLKLVVDYDFK